MAAAAPPRLTFFSLFGLRFDGCTLSPFQLTKFSPHLHVPLHPQFCRPLAVRLLQLRSPLGAAGCLAAREPHARVTKAVFMTHCPRAMPQICRPLCPSSQRAARAGRSQTLPRQQERRREGGRYEACGLGCGEGSGVRAGRKSGEAGGTACAGG